MKCEIISVGTEVLTGDIVDTNAPFLSKGLISVGMDIAFRTTVGDDSDKMNEALKLASERAEIIITIGGLGPTYDDFTKYETAKVMGRKIVREKKLEEWLKNYFSSVGYTLTENNFRQADIIEGCEIIENHNGTAPGLIAKNEKNTFVLLPGPPGELKPMFFESILPYLKKFTDKAVVEKTLKLCGAGESAVEDKLHEMMVNTKNPVIAPYAKPGEVHLKLTAEAENEKEAIKLIENTKKKIYEDFSDKIYGEDEETLASSVVKLLKERNMTLSLAESCTGGGIAFEITSVPGSSSVFGFGAVTYANEAKVKIAGVSEETLRKHGAVSPETALEMAEGIRNLSGSDIGLSVTGIAGPDGGTKEKPVGLVYMGISLKNNSYTKRLMLKGNREKIRESTAKKALTEIFQLLKENGNG